MGREAHKGLGGEEKRRTLFAESFPHHDRNVVDADGTQNHNTDSGGDGEQPERRCMQSCRESKIHFFMNGQVGSILSLRLRQQSRVTVWAKADAFWRTL